MSQDQIYFAALGVALPLVLIVLHGARTRITLGPFFGVAGVYSLMLWQLLQTGWWVSLFGFNFNAALTLFIPSVLLGFLLSFVLDGLRTARAYALMVLATSGAAWAFSLFREALAQHVPLPYLIVLSNSEHLAIVLGLVFAQVACMVTYAGLRRHIAWGALPAAEGSSVALWLVTYSFLQFDPRMGVVNLGNEFIPFLIASLPSLLFAASYGYLAQRMRLLMPERTWASLLAFWKEASPDDDGSDELTNRDRVVSELRLLNRQLEQDSLIMETHLEHAAYGILIVEEKGRVLRANAAAARLLGKPALQGQAIETLFAEVFDEHPTLSHLQHHKEQRCRLRNSEGHDRWVDIALTPLTREQRNTRAGYYLILKDVTAAVQEERRRLVSSRIHDLHQTGRVLTHDFSNLLMGAQAQLTRLKSAHCDGAQRQALDAVDHALHRAREMLQQLGGGSQFGTPRLVLQDLGDLVGEAVAICRAAAEESGITVHFAHDGPWMVEADGSQMIRVFTNLLKNAIRASDCGGRIDVAIARQGTGLLVTITDEGRGLPADQLQLAFEPGFSTKGEGKGGLGLAISYLMVDAHGGHLELQPNPLGRGLCATVWLPEARNRDMGHTDIANVAVIVATPLTGTTDALIGELERRGCQVAEAANWDEIDALIEENPGWQVLLLDPQLDGPGQRQRLPASLQVRPID
jgi:PAS domain S-box-containing protein